MITWIDTKYFRKCITKNPIYHCPPYSSNQGAKSTKFQPIRQKHHEGDSPRRGGVWILAMRNERASLYDRTENATREAACTMHTESLRSMHYEKGSTPHPLFPEPGPGRFHNFVPTPSVLLPCTPGFPPFRSSSLFLSREQLPADRTEEKDSTTSIVSRAGSIGRRPTILLITDLVGGKQKGMQPSCFCVELINSEWIIFERFISKKYPRNFSPEYCIPLATDFSHKVSNWICITQQNLDYSELRFKLQPLVELNKSDDQTALKSQIVSYV